MLWVGKGGGGKGKPHLLNGVCILLLFRFLPLLCLLFKREKESERRECVRCGGGGKKGGSEAV